MNQTKKSTIGFLFGMALLTVLTGCVGYVDGPRAGVYEPTSSVYVETGVAAQDDYVYYPGYQVYYSGFRHQYVYQDGRSWVSRPTPPRVSADKLFASPSVKVDFHDSPANHHAEIVKQYPKQWAPPPANRDNHDERGTEDKRKELSMSPKHFYETDSHSTPEIQKDNPMNRTQHLAGRFGIALCGALLACAAHGQPAVSVGVSAPSVQVALPSIEIRADSDFYEPLAPEGEWVTVGSYGRCWRPGGVASDWRPYCNGSWEQTDAGWYWVSDEPWAWATYHYGRWDYTDQFGWYWVPQTQWAPAWVSWHEGGGYVGWAPLQPFVSISARGFVGFDQSRISPRAFVFVKQGQFLDPIRPSIVVVNGPTIINKTKIVTNTRIVNNKVINGGPATAVIEKASGRKVQLAQVQQLRQQAEAPVAAKQRTSKAATESKIQTPARNEVVPAKEKVVAHVPALAEKPDAITRAPAKSPVKNYETPVEKHNPAPAAPESRPEVKPEASRAPMIKESTGQNAPRQPASQEKPAPAEDKKAQQPAREQPTASEKNGADQADKNHDNKP